MQKNKIKKLFVLDTNILCYDPLALVGMGGDNDIYIPISVVEELDRIKSRDDIAGMSARDSIRILFVAMTMNAISGDGVDIVQLYERVAEDYGTRGLSIVSRPEGTGGKLRIARAPSRDELNQSFLDFHKDQVDAQVILTALNLSKNNPNVYLISKDAQMRILAELSGVKTEDLHRDSVNLNVAERHPGYKLIEQETDTIEQILSGKHPALSGMVENEFAVVVRESHRVIFQLKEGTWKQISNGPRTIFGQSPRTHTGGISLEQTLAFHLLQDPDIQCVCFSGEAGTGKSYIAMAQGMSDAVHDKKTLSIFRPLSSASEKDIGYLPGTLNEKIAPWYEPVSEILNQLIRSQNGHMKGETLESLIKHNKISFKSLMHIRGSTLLNRTVVLDEAQDTTPYLMRLFTTRVGQNTRLLVTGDLYQASDLHRLKPNSNGLAFLIANMRGSRLFAHLMLKDVVRSDFARDAASRLKVRQSPRPV